jgi:hypothetical protein
MKTRFLVTLILALSSIVTAMAQSFPKTLQLGVAKDTWTKNQLIEPAALAAILNNSRATQPLIYNLGVVDDIKGAKNMGAASEKENLARFKETIKTLPKNTFMIVYCGCCPFERCPNIRPAFQAVKDGGFPRGRLLNLPANLKTDWISKGYPLADK